MVWFKSKLTEHLLWVHDLTRYGRSCDRKRPTQVNLGIRAAFASLEVSSCRGNTNFAVGQESHAGLTNTAAWCDHLDTRFNQRLDEACLEALQIYLLGSRRDNEAHSLCNLAPTQHARGNLNVLESPVGTRPDLRLMDAHALGILDRSNVAKLMRLGNDKRHFIHIEPDLVRVVSAWVRHKRLIGHLGAAFHKFVRCIVSFKHSELGPKLYAMSRQARATIDGELGYKGS